MKIKTTFRVKSVTQFPERRQRPRLFDTHPGRSAREWFDYLQDRRNASRPIITPARVEKVRRALTDGKTYIQRIERPPVYGAPTFRNVIENGQHV